MCRFLGLHFEFVLAFSSEVKGWRLFLSRTLGRRFRPTLAAAEPHRAKREPGVRGSQVRAPEDLAEKDRPIDPMSGKNTPASPSPIRFRA